MSANAQTLGFSPANLSLAPGERALVAISVSGNQDDAVSAFQIRLTFDPTIIRVRNPNEAFRGTVAPFAPLGGSGLCTTVRAVTPCPDPDWLLSLGGRIPMQGPERIDNTAGIVQIVYGTQGNTAPAAGGGAIALLEVVAVQDGSTAISIDNSVLANQADPPASIAHVRTVLAVTVTARTGNNPPTLNPIGGQAVAEGQNLTIDLSASDPDGDALSYSAGGLPAFATLTDRGDTTASISVTPGFLNAGAYMLTVAVSDAELGAEESFTLVVANTNRPPVLSSPGNQANAENDAVSFVVAASDPDGEVLTFAASNLPPGVSINAQTGQLAGVISFAGGGSYNSEVRVSDGSATTGVNFGWTVTEVNQPPLLTVPGDQADSEGDVILLALVASDPDGDTLTFSAANLPPGLSVNPATGAISGTVGFDAADSYAVQASVSDGTDTGNGTFNWTIAELNQAPLLTSPGDQGNSENELVKLPLAASDPDGDTLTFSATNLPPGLSINVTTGVIGGTPGFDTAGNYPVQVSVTDGTDTAQVSFNWDISDLNRVPLLTSPGNQSNSEGDVLNLALVASDPDGDTLTFSAASLPPGLGVDSTTGLLSGTIGFDAAGSYAVQVSASDGTDTTSVDFAWTIANVNRPPDLASPGDQRSGEGEMISLQLAAADPDGDALTFSTTNLPPGLGINPSSGVISGTLDFNSAATYAVQANVNDGTDSASVNFSWAVTETNQSPVLTPPGDQRNREGDVINLALSATDDDGDALTFGVVNLPPGLSVNPATGVISGTLSFDAAGSYGVQASVTDGIDTGNAGFNWTVDDLNRAPTINSPGNQQSDEGESVLLAITAADPDGDSLSFTATGLPPGLAIDAASGVVSGVLNFASAGVHNVGLAVSDTDATAVTDIVWTVGGVNQAPVLSRPGDQSSNEGEPISLSLVASDADGDTLSFSATNLPPGLAVNPASGAINGTLGFDAAGSYAVQASAADGTDTSSVSFGWMVANVNRMPELISPGDQANQEGDTVNLVLEASDADGDSLSFTASGLPPGLNINAANGVISGTPGFDAAGSYAVMASVTDGTDTSNASFGWTIAELNQRPRLDSPGDQRSNEGDPVSLSLVASDPDGDTLSFVATGLPPGLVINPASGVVAGTPGFDAAGDYTVQISADDGSDATSVSFRWTLVNVNRPPVIDPPGEQRNEEGESIVLATPASDEDGDVLTFSAGGLPPGLGIAPASGVISGTLGFDAAGSYDVSVTANDGIVSVTIGFAWVVGGVNRSPELVNPGDQAGDEGASVRLELVADDPDLDTLTFSAAGLPADLVVDPASGVVSGTLSFAAAGTHSVQVSVTDGIDTAGQAFVWTVRDRNRAPELVSPGDQSNTELDTVSLSLVASDDDGDRLTFSATGLPDNLTIDAASGAISGEFGANAAGTYAVRASVSDGAADSFVNFTWVVLAGNAEPQLGSPGPQTNAEGDTVSLQLVASDDDGDTLSFAAAGLPPGLGIDAATGLIAGSLDHDSAGSYLVTADAGDGSVTATVSFSWLVTNTNRSPLLEPLSAQQNDEGDSVSAAAHASDPDGDMLTFAAFGLPSGVSIGSGDGIISGLMSFDAAGDYAVTVSASDGSESALVSFDWTVLDVNRAPVITHPGDQESAVGSAVTMTLVASDADGDALEFRASNLPPGLEIAAASGVIAGTIADTAGNYAVTVTASDGIAKGSVAFQWQVTEAANSPPEVVHPGDQENREGDSVSLQIEAFDDDGNTLTYMANGLPAALGIDAASGAITGTIAEKSAGAYAVQVQVSDGSDQSETLFNWRIEAKGIITSIEVPIDRNQDDAQERLDTAEVVRGGALHMVDRSDGTNQLVGLRFRKVGIPRGATIREARIQFTARRAGDGVAELALQGEAVGHAKRFRHMPHNLSQRPRTSAAVEWQVDAWRAAGAAGPAEGSPDIASVVQEIVSRRDWEAGNSLAILIGGSGRRVAKSFNTLATVAPVLHLEFEVPPPNLPPQLANPGLQFARIGDIVELQLDASDADGDALTFSAVGLPLVISIDRASGTISGTVASGSVGDYLVAVTVDDGRDTTEIEFLWSVRPASGFVETVTAVIGRNRDDAQENLQSHNVHGGGALVLAANRRGIRQLVGLRFEPIPIPREAIVRSAYLQFAARKVSRGHAPLIIAGEAAADPAGFTRINGNLSGRARTITEVMWSPPDWLLKDEAEFAQRTPDLSEIIQELLLQPRTVVEQRLVLFISGHGRRVAHSHNSNPDLAPILVIEYEIL